ncbi:uncharacterized protein LOC133182704 [Saccostrea echinata]|uniref:uncharacterized protein LOC133182704 n=1 Tax=Saccostrea echinata TaxID=191078 RepID=UPI002A81A95E|nr:uncharacterized protein LOC133182704 [Saccostrea echinata]
MASESNCNSVSDDCDRIKLVRNPPERIGHVAVCSDKYMIVWGGYNDDFNPPYTEKYLPANELWIYNTEFKVWYFERCNVHPVAASGSTVCLGDGYMYLFGGHARYGNVNDLFRLDLSTLEWEKMTPQDKNEKMTPSPRDKAVSWYYEKKFYTFGGFGVPTKGYMGEGKSFFQDEIPEQRGWNNQLCVFDVTTMEWSIPDNVGPKPSARAAHTAVRFGSKVYIFGGRHLNLRLNDVHCLDLNSLSWSGRLFIDGCQPEGRSWHTAVGLSDNRMFVYGGFTTDCQPLSDSWILNINSLQWTQLTHFPQNRCRLWHTACVTQDQDVLIYGGCEKNILDYDSICEIKNDILEFQFEPYTLKKLCIECVYRFRVRLGSQWDSLPRPISDWLHKKETLDIQLLMSSDSDFYSDCLEDDSNVMWTLSYFRANFGWKATSTMAMKTIAAFSSLVIVFAYLAKLYFDRSSASAERMSHILSGLLRAEKKIDAPRTRVALGFGGCEDLIVDGMTFIDKFNLEAPGKPKHHDSVGTKEELSELFGYFFQHGAAAERYVSNNTLFKELTDTAFSMADHKSILGGNAPVMARRMANEGAEVLLGARFTKELRQTLPDTVKVVGEDLDVNDIHLLLEYKSGDKWGKFISPRANRLIVHSDESNPFIETLEGLEAEIKTFKPAALVVGGLQMLDNFPFEDGERIRRITKLKNLLASTPRKTSIHFELASFTDEKLLREIRDNVVLYSDSLGMNEQELPNLVSILTKGKVTLVADAYPRIAPVLDQMRQVYDILSKTEEVDGRRKVSRIHVHTLAYQAILTKKGSQWKKTMHATAKASLTAFRHVCNSKYIDTEKARLIMDDSFSSSTLQSAQRIPLEENRPVSCWEEKDYQICVAPVLVCTKVVQTGGGGDNISSAGLLVQVE